VPDKTTREDRRIDRTSRAQVFFRIVSISAVSRVVSVKEKGGSDEIPTGAVRSGLLSERAGFIRPAARRAAGRASWHEEHYLVFLTAEGDAKRMVTSPEGKALFAQHREFVRGNLEARKFLLAGPVTDASPLSGFAVAAARDEAQAREWEAEDPLAKSGKFHFEVHPVLLQSLDVLKYEFPK
jgi:uncharacterized protein YciI